MLVFQWAMIAPENKIHWVLSSNLLSCGYCLLAYIMPYPYVAILYHYSYSGYYKGGEFLAIVRGLRAQGQEPSAI